MTTGKYVSLRRQQIGMSQTDLAKKAGCTPQAISLIENDKRGIPTKKLQTFANALECNVDDLIHAEIIEPGFDTSKAEIQKELRGIFDDLQKTMKQVMDLYLKIK